MSAQIPCKLHGAMVINTEYMPSLQSTICISNSLVTGTLLPGRKSVKLLLARPSSPTSLNEVTSKCVYCILLHKNKTDAVTDNTLPSWAFFSFYYLTAMTSPLSLNTGRRRSLLHGMPLSLWTSMSVSSRLPS